MTKINDILERFRGLEEGKNFEFLELLEDHILKLIFKNVSNISSSEVLKSERALKEATAEIMEENGTYFKKCPTAPPPSLAGDSCLSLFSTFSPKTPMTQFNIDVDDGKQLKYEVSKNINFDPISILPLSLSSTQLTPTIGVVLGGNIQSQFNNESDFNSYDSLLRQFGGISLTDTTRLQNSTPYIPQFPNDTSLQFLTTQIPNHINSSVNVNTINHFANNSINNNMNSGDYNTNGGFNYNDPTYNTNIPTGYNTNIHTSQIINYPTGYNTTQSFPCLGNDMPVSGNLHPNMQMPVMPNSNPQEYPVPMTSMAPMAPMNDYCPPVLQMIPSPMDSTFVNNNMSANGMNYLLQALPSPQQTIPSPPLTIHSPPNPPKVSYTYERPDSNSSRFFNITLPVSPISPPSVSLDTRIDMPSKQYDDPINEEGLAPLNIDAILDDSDEPKNTNVTGTKKIKMMSKIIGNPFSINKGIWTPDADFLNKHDTFETLTDKKLNVASNSKFFIIKTPNISDIQISYLHNTWTSTSRGNKILNNAYLKANSNTNKGSMDSETEKVKIYLIFSYIQTDCFCGVAEMTSAVNFDTLNPIWQNSQKYGGFDIKWLTIKDIPFEEFKCIILKYPEGDYKCVTYSRDSQELSFPVGKRVIDIFNCYLSTASFLDVIGDSEPNKQI
ncbi:unnamed protein product [[Candida] boidinii]|uniref:Unnamed protein product n=1 Tax=Candida boidinii TaxID=5477 RepID=A0ACB5TIH3_CANBO|nr:unnamed protein product [[Candida] boidinii]